MGDFAVVLLPQGVHLRLPRPEGSTQDFLRTISGAHLRKFRRPLARSKSRSQIIDLGSLIHSPRFQISVHLDPRQQAALINSKWPADIARQQEQIDVLRGLLGGP